MAFLTASDIAELIRQGFAADGIKNVQIKDYAADIKRRKYPFIEIVNVEPTGTEADIRVTTITQKFTVTYYERKRGAGSSEITKIKKVEDSVLNKLDNSVLGSGTLFTENKSWTRSAQVIERPIPHYRSILSVLVTDIVSTSGEGSIGAKMLLTIGSLTDMQLFSKPIEREVEGVEDVYDDTRTRKRVAPIGDTQSFFGEFEWTQARMNTLRTLKASHTKIACILKRDGVPENFNGFLIEMSHGSGYSEEETIVVRIEIVP